MASYWNFYKDVSNKTKNKDVSNKTKSDNFSFDVPMPLFGVWNYLQFSFPSLTLGRKLDFGEAPIESFLKDCCSLLFANCFSQILYKPCIIIWFFYCYFSD